MPIALGTEIKVEYAPAALASARTATPASAGSATPIVMVEGVYGGIENNRLVLEKQLETMVPSRERSLIPLDEVRVIRMDPGTYALEGVSVGLALDVLFFVLYANAVRNID